MTKKETEFAVLLYPPKGRPRVTEIPKMPSGMRAHAPLATFPTRNKAEAALERFLNDNPEYRRWNDGRIVPEAAAVQGK